MKSTETAKSPTKKKTNRRKKKKTQSSKLSFIVKPKKMSLEDWQIALRRQIAETEKYNISCTDEDGHPGEYQVWNPKTQQTYKVVYRGYQSEWNYCSCMDFRTSGLGTCKHLEGVKKWLNGNRKRYVRKELPPYTSVYLSYKGFRQVKIRIGTDHKAEFEELASKYFDSNHVMLASTYQKFGQFIKEAYQIDNNFRFYDDAIEFITNLREREFRKEILSAYNDERLDNILSVKLYPYQKEGVRFAFERGKVAIADEMGLGKTIQAIAAAEIFRREGLTESALIICPTSLKYQWKREIERFTKVKALVIEGNHLKRKELYRSTEPYKIISYNSACNDIKILGGLDAELLIMDEVQRLKNWNTQIAKAARKIRSRYAVILSGTPLENKLEELYSVMELVDQFCLSPYFKFRDNHINTNDTGKVIGYQNLNHIGEKVSDRLIRRTKKQVALQMPERQDKNLFVPMTDEQAGIHEEFAFHVSILVKKWNKMKFLSEADHLRMLKLLSQMRMVCDSTFILDQKTRYDTKIDEIRNILLDIFSNSDDEKVVIFSQWERMTRLIAQELDKADIEYANLHGSVPSEKRMHLIENFNDNPNCRVFLSTDAGSTGLNLQVASTLINVDLPWNPAVLEQRIARIYRLGQKRNIQVINMVSDDSFEASLIDKLKFKTDMFEGVLDNGKDSILIGDKSKLAQMMEDLTEIFDEQNPPKGEKDLHGLNEEEMETEQAKEDTDSSMAENSLGEMPINDALIPSDENTSEDVEVDSNKNRPNKSGDQPHSTGEPPVNANEENNAYGNKPEAETQTEADKNYPVSNQGNESSHTSRKPTEPQSPEELVSQGVSFLSGLAKTLKSPEATEQLVNSLVETDESTGETSIRIPVADKQSVKNMLTMLGKLFG